MLPVNAVTVPRFVEINVSTDPLSQLNLKITFFVLSTAIASFSDGVECNFVNIEIYRLFIKIIETAKRFMFVANEFSTAAAIRRANCDVLEKIVGEINVFG